MRLTVTRERTLDSSQRAALARQILEELDREHYANNKVSLGTRTLYHETKYGPEIKADGRMYRGHNGGYAGNGIYFADSPQAAHRKARTHGWMVTARVRMGEALEVKSSHDFTDTEVHSYGGDSVLITSLNGDEYVVYDWGRVEIVSVEPY
eukprot:TRINITY_DN71675_c0_g1_i1.p1 TRINITY_DN71675_c0_g1~~TRINITY_DN71675_c0_g1_i1.p1  ORF type:complete len:151 (+),score=11.44 TRINITY_DN71675_c0_g1_i1:69-521(+)